MNNLYLSNEAQNDLAEIKAYITDELENPGAALATVRKITVPNHNGDLKPGTLNSIYKQAGLK